MEEGRKDEAVENVQVVEPDKETGLGDVLLPLLEYTT
jgi:hypothetical protein